MGIDSIAKLKNRLADLDETISQLAIQNFYSRAGTLAPSAHALILNAPVNFEDDLSDIDPTFTASQFGTAPRFNVPHAERPGYRA